MSKGSGRTRCAFAAGVMAALAGGGVAQAQLSQGPDVVYSDCVDITNWGAVGGIRGYSLGSYTCNIGNQNLRWGNTWSGTPALAMNAYRLANGRLEQIGMSWVKYSCCAAVGNGCGLGCNGQGSSVLGVGCRDIYTASYNGGQSRLGPRSQVNPSTGQITRDPGSSGNAIFRRLQVHESDLNPTLNPGALYFVEGVYVASDDAPLLANGANAANNASYKRVTVGTNYALNVTGSMQVGVPAIAAWRDHGNGLNTPDPNVVISTYTVPGDGIFYVACRPIDLGNGRWRYEYAVFNMNSHRAAGSLSVPVSSSVNVSGVGFKDVDYHSGEPYDNTDWVVNVGGGAAVWSSPQTFEQNPNSNALRWGTMYNFWFEADEAPVLGEVSIGLFRPGAAGEPASFQVEAPVPGGGCRVDWNGDESVNSSDISEFLSTWVADVQNGTLNADFDGTGQVSSNDIAAFLNAWLDAVAGGC